MDMDEAAKYDDVVWCWFSWSWWWSCWQWWPFTVYHADFFELILLFLPMVMMRTLMETSCICTASRFDRGATRLCTQPDVLRTRAGTWGPTNVGKTSCRRKKWWLLFFEKHIGNVKVPHCHIDYMIFSWAVVPCAFPKSRGSSLLRPIRAALALLESRTAWEMSRSVAWWLGSRCVDPGNYTPRWDVEKLVMGTCCRKYEKKYPSSSFNIEFWRMYPPWN